MNVNGIVIFEWGRINNPSLDYGKGLLYTTPPRQLYHSRLCPWVNSPRVRNLCLPNPWEPSAAHLSRNKKNFAAFLRPLDFKLDFYLLWGQEAMPGYIVSFLLAIINLKHWWILRCNRDPEWFSCCPLTHWCLGPCVTLSWWCHWSPSHLPRSTTAKNFLNL